MKNLTIGIIVSLVILGGIVYLSYPRADEVAQQNSGGIAFASEHTEFDFGTISMKAGKVSHTFKIKNNSQSDISISRISTSCMCTVASLKYGSKVIGPFGMPGHGGYAPRIREVLPAGAEAEVEVVFDPAAHGPAGVGTASRAVYIESGAGEPFTLAIKANVTP